MPIFRVKSVKIYTSQKEIYTGISVGSVTNIRYDPCDHDQLVDQAKHGVRCYKMDVKASIPGSGRSEQDSYTTHRWWLVAQPHCDPSQHP